MLKYAKVSIAIVVFIFNFPLVIYASSPLFPLITEQFTHQHQVIKQIPDILGFRLLMSVQDVENRTTQLLKDGYKIKHNENTLRSLSDRNENIVSYRYGRITTMVYKNHDYIILNYTSHLLGNRIQSIYRILNFEDQVNFKTLEQNIFSKFGDPSYRAKDEDHKNYRYFYNENIKLKDKGIKTTEMSRCWYASLEVPKSFYPHVFIIDRTRINRYLSCIGGIEINAFYGSKKSLSKKITMFLWDGDLVFKNLKIQDEFLLEALQEEVSSRTGITAPSL